MIDLMRNENYNGAGWYNRRLENPFRCLYSIGKFILSSFIIFIQWDSMFIKSCENSMRYLCAEDPGNM